MPKEVERTAQAAPGALSAPGLGGELTIFGPIGTLISTFIGILQPVVDAASIVDDARREEAIQTALLTNEAKISQTGKELATAVDNFVAASRHRAAGAFVEQLVTIRETPIDLTAIPDCKNLSPAERLPSGAPDPSFIRCWGTAWAKLQPQVDKLTTLGDSYDALADSGNVSAKDRFDTIIANYKAVRNNRLQLSNHMIDETTEFINFANAVAAAASKSNVDKLKTEAAAVVH